MNKKGRFDYVSQAYLSKEEVLTEEVEEEEEEEEEISEVLPVVTVTGETATDGALQLGLHVLMHADQYMQPPQRRGRKAAENAQTRMNIPREQMNIRIRPELKQAAAMLAGAKRLSLGDVVEAALVEYLKKHAASGLTIE